MNDFFYLSCLIFTTTNWPNSYKYKFECLKSDTILIFKTNTSKNYNKIHVKLAIKTNLIMTESCIKIVPIKQQKLYFANCNKS